MFQTTIEDGEVLDFETMSQKMQKGFLSAKMENETHVILISGRYVTHKFDTSSSCLTYKFKQDNLGFKSIEQQRQLPLVGTVGLDHEYM